MLPILNIGPLALQTPGLILLIGIWIGLNLAEKSARRQGINPDRIYALTFIALAVGIISARLSFAAQNPGAFINNLLSLVSLTPQMMDWLGGAFFSILAALIYGQKKGLSFWNTLDALTPGFAVFMIANGFSQLASGDAFGAPADLPWSIYLWGEFRHPTQVYSILAAFLVAWVVLPVKPGQIFPPGATSLIFAALSAFAYLFIATFRGDAEILVGGFRSGQVIAWLTLAGVLYLLHRRLAAK